MSNDSVRNELNAFNGSGASPGGSKIVIPDFSSVKAVTYYASPGSYAGTVISLKNVLSKAASKPMLEFKFEAPVANGETLMATVNCPLASAALWKLANVCNSLGIEQGEIDADKVVGLKCTLLVKDSGVGDNGNKWCEVYKCAPPGQETGPDKASTVDTAGPAFPVDDVTPF